MPIVSVFRTYSVLFCFLAPALVAAPPALAKPEQTSTYVPPWVTLADSDLAELDQASQGSPGDEEPPPEHYYRDFFAVEDLNDDGINDTIYHEFVSPYTRVRAISGADGSDLWATERLIHHRLAAWRPVVHAVAPLKAYHAPFRPGLPPPQIDVNRGNVLPAGDVSGDGRTDFLWLAMKREPVQLLGYLSYLIRFDWSLFAVDGASGQILWERPYIAQRREALTTASEHYRMESWPTSILAFSSATGPKFGVIVTTLTFSGNTDRYVTEETLQLGNTSTSELFWERKFLPVESLAPPVAMWFTGAADVGGDSELELILDRGRAFYHDPALMTVQALRGELDGGGVDLWGPVSYYTPPHRGSLSLTEEVYEQIAIFHVELLPDVTGDGVAEVMPTYLTAVVENSEETTLAGAWRTHLAPMSGTNGSMLWAPRDIKFQGWGFASAVGGRRQPDPGPTDRIFFPGAIGTHWEPMRDYGRHETVPFIAFGTTDFPSGFQIFARPPVYDVRMMVLKATDGEPQWTYRERFPMDNTVTVQFASWQFLVGLAPVDADGDGLLELVTPPSHESPSGNRQVLVTQMHHTYKVLDSMTGQPLRSIRVWGPFGTLVECAGSSPGEFTTLAGYSRRWDFVRIAAANGREVWRAPFHNNPTPQAQTAGILTEFLGPRCGEQDRRALSVNIGLYSKKRDGEIIAAVGYVGDGPAADWVLPRVRGHPPAQPVLNLSMVFEAPEPPTSPVVRLALGWGPALPGLALGLATNFAAGRRKRRTVQANPAEAPTTAVATAPEGATGWWTP